MSQVQATTTGRCATCGALVDLEDLFCANCGTEIPDHGSNRVGHLTTTRARNFECRGCGATMNYDAGAQALKCPFCGSVDLVEDADSRGILQPDFVVPFAVDRNAAEDTLRAWLGSSFWHPGDLRALAQLTELKPVYLPFWVFTTKVRTHWTADTSQTPSGARADWYPLAGYTEREYADVWVPASHGVPLAEMATILPFDVSAAVPPDGVNLEDVTVEQFAVSRRYARPLAQRRLEALETSAVEQQVPGRSRNVHVNVLMDGATSRPALVPVFVMAYRYRERVYRFLVNGQTGRSTGTAPTSPWRVAGVAGAVVLVVLIIVALVLLTH